MVGCDYEVGGIVKYGVKMVIVVVCVWVFKLIVVIGGFYGVGNYLMCGCVYLFWFLWMWLNVWILVMGGEQVVFVLVIVCGEQLFVVGIFWLFDEEEVFKVFI